ncbi:DUF3172 domain-containing protein [Cyanobium gracile UHCC 0139]|uniref:DUF3172 domain-containing protein n=1 Tax=Cyanobium gracile UHCC 0139 TaxID=3110308 RepID=A0ABU5RNJ6_9CYAN|nr:DUF3172 domain-containing protein [Cyanobium gracile]MEA5389663.1 DUF3172 domain-containing protein [Cyanobium gracile UHCC 0139]
MTRSRSSAGRSEPGGYAPRPDRATPRYDPRSDRYDDRGDRFATGYGRREDPRYGPERRGSNGGGGGRPPAGNGGGPSGGGPNIQLNVATVAVLAGVLVVGIGIGSAVTSTTQGNQGNIASAQQLDMAVPDPEFCKQWGASAFVMDIELYTTMNPSSSFVTQPTLQPGCVIRRENWSVLQKEGAVTAEQMRQCKQRMNTFAYIGSVRDKPIVRCVYQTDISGNKFQTRGVAGAADDAVGITPEADQF